MKYLKNNLLIILIFTFLLSFITYKTLDYKQEYELSFKSEQSYYSEKCSNTTNISERETEICKQWQLSLEEMEKPDFFETLSNIISSKISILDSICILFLVIPSLFLINQIFKDQVLINMLTRESYSKFLRKLFTKVYRYIWLFPTLLIIFIGLLLSFTKLNLSIDVFSSNDNPILFLICYVLNSLIVSGIYLNIALISLRYKHNYVVSCITSFIVYLALVLFFQIGIDYVLIQNTLEIDGLVGLFTMTGIFDVNTWRELSILPILLINISLYIILSLGVYLIYKNKEKLIIDCEKNNKEEV
ncbi:MAG: hypothetical protein IJ501_05285 [Bacilli bacterium]|nr:hypothetical protein [Bacilli bacterium]